MGNTAQQVPADISPLEAVVPPRISWKAIAPIFADVVVSPWNLLVGGLLTTRLSFGGAALSILIGYAVLSLLFYFYGGLGFHARKTTSHLIEPVFGRRGTKTFFSGVLALGQIGWFAIICQIAGESLGVLFRLPPSLGIIVFALLMLAVASLKLHHHGILKALVVFSSLGLFFYLAYVGKHQISELQFDLQHFDRSTFFWGISIISTSLISFLSVSPDFLSMVESKSDVKFSILWGIFVPGVATTLLGAALFSGVSDLSMLALVGVGSLAFVGHVLNVLTNTDASVALFTPGHRLSYMLDISFFRGLILASIMGTVLALMSVADSLEVWLSVLASVYPAIIGVTIAWYSLEYFGMKRSDRSRSVEWRAILTILACSLLFFTVQISLLPWLVAAFSFFMYILMTGVTVKIYIGELSEDSGNQKPKERKSPAA